MSEQHHANIYSAVGHGHWATCPCGWSSGTYGTKTGAHLAFGRHLLDAEHITRTAHSAPALPARATQHSEETTK